MSDFLSVSQALLPSTEDIAPSSSEQLLRFHLAPDMAALLPLPQLTEVLNISMGQIVPISHMPNWVMGVYNWRGEILWMVDLNHLVGLTPWYQQTRNGSTHTAIVLNVRANNATTKNKNQMLGLVVNRVEDIEWCNPDWIQSPPASAVTPELAPFLRGYWLKSSGEMLAVLDGEAIAAVMPQS